MSLLPLLQQADWRWRRGLPSPIFPSTLAAVNDKAQSFCSNGENLCRRNTCCIE
jgi:hypothetical protein